MESSFITVANVGFILALKRGIFTGKNIAAVILNIKFAYSKNRIFVNYVTNR